MSVKTRRWIERQFVTLVVRALLATGKKLQIDRQEEGRGWIEIKDDSPASIDEIMACDDERLWADGGSYVYFVYGNNGWEVVSDYTVDLEDVLAPVNKLAVDEDMDALLTAVGKTLPV